MGNGGAGRQAPRLHHSPEIFMDFKSLWPSFDRSVSLSSPDPACCALSWGAVVPVAVQRSEGVSPCPIVYILL